MRQIESLENDLFYHVYNRGINSCNIFNEPTNYEHFLRLYGKFISPVAETYAWVLMPNHIHLLIRIKSGLIYKYSKNDFSYDPTELNLNRSKNAIQFNDVKWETVNLSAFEKPESVKIPKPSVHFSHLFNSYAKYFNIKNNRHGSLFEHPFKRKLISNETYLKRVLVYIHHNPVHHGFCEHPLAYPWSSYNTCLSDKPTKLLRKEVINLFGNTEKFTSIHNDVADKDNLDNWLGI